MLYFILPEILCIFNLTEYSAKLKDSYASQGLSVKSFLLLKQM